MKHNINRMGKKQMKMRRSRKLYPNGKHDLAYKRVKIYFEEPRKRFIGLGNEEGQVITENSEIASTLKTCLERLYEKG